LLREGGGRGCNAKINDIKKNLFFFLYFFLFYGRQPSGGVLVIFQYRTAVYWSWEGGGGEGTNGNNQYLFPLAKPSTQNMRTGLQAVGGK
jgi:hypothetical protein